MTHISTVHISGFRNFKQAQVNLCEQTLIIGANDVGKSNFIYGLRLLLDKNLSEADLEPLDSDFFAFENTNAFVILAKFEKATEDCIIAKFKQYVSDDGIFWLGYRGYRDPVTRQKTYELLVGPSHEDLAKIDGRFYLRVLNLRFIGSQRELGNYIRRERRHLLEDARKARSVDEVTNDATTLMTLSTSMDAVNESVGKLSYIKRATTEINKELSRLSYHNTTHDVIFDAQPEDPSEYVENVNLVTRVRGKNLSISGDGRSNQIHLSLWAARNQLSSGESSEPLEVSIFCVEEPEAHLHPHQQRRMSEYLFTHLKSQVLITTHSPHIASEFPPGSIVRMYESGTGTQVAGNGCNPAIESAFLKFGYRLNAIPVESIFASVVLLVEGPSEELFYRALARALDISLDRLNISILGVAGVGFRPYASLLSSLGIRFAIRTDNDIFKVPRTNTYRMAGIQRALDLAKTFFPKFLTTYTLLAQENELKGFTSEIPPASVQGLCAQISEALKKEGVYVAGRDLEHDLLNTLMTPLMHYTQLSEESEIIAFMKEHKATFMFDFLKNGEADLSILDGSSQPFQGAFPAA